eukprot:7385434-Prymnesium_polylepis.2
MDLLLGLDEEDVDALEHDEVHDEYVPAAAAAAADPEAAAVDAAAEAAGRGERGDERLQGAGGARSLLSEAYSLDDSGRMVSPSVHVRGDAVGSLGLFAKRDISVGEVIFTERPQLTVAINAAQRPHCGWCLRSLHECPPGLPHASFWPASPRRSSCDGCGTLFCCDSCRKGAAACGHHRLCGAIASGELDAYEVHCRSMSRDELFAGVAVIVLKMLAHLLAAAERGGEEALLEAKPRYAHFTRGSWDDGEGGGQRADGSSSATRALFSRTVATLQVTLGERKWFDEALMRDLFRAAAVNAALLQPLSPFGDYVTASRSVRRIDGGEMLRALELHGQELRAQHAARLDDAQTIDEVYAEMYGVRGGGLFKLHSKINHSCTPSTSLVCSFTDSTIDVVAKTAIRAGEELTLGYVDPTLDGSRRRMTLRTCYGFECTCKRCKLEMPS